MVFIPLDSENLSEEKEDTLSNDFGDNIFPYLHINANTQLREKQNEEEIEEF